MDSAEADEAETTDIFMKESSGRLPEVEEVETTDILMNESSGRLPDQTTAFVSVAKLTVPPPQV